MRKLFYAFNSYDIDKNGHLDREEVMEVLNAMLSLYAYEHNKDDLNKLVNECFTVLDKNKDGVITRSNVKVILFENVN